MKHLLRTASVAGIVFGLGLFGSAAFAQTNSAGNNGGNATQTTTTDSANSYNVPITNSGNSSADSHDNNSVNTDNSQNYNVPISDSGNTADSNNSSTDSHDNNSQNYSVPISDSGNTDNSTHSDSHNNNSTNYSVPISDSGNTDSHANNSTNNSNDSSMSIGNVTLAVGYEDLTGSVSGQTFSAGNNGGNVTAGALTIQGNAMQGFAGINNATYNTGFGSLGQATNAVTATSSVTFQ